jgi:hypothetical protein
MKNNISLELRQRLVYQFLDFIVLQKLSVSEKPKSGRTLINSIFDSFGFLAEDGYFYSLLGMNGRKTLH